MRTRNSPTKKIKANSPEFRNWFQQASQIPNAYIYLKSITPHDISVWQQLTKTNLSQLSLEKASELTITFKKQQKEAQIAKTISHDFSNDLIQEQNAQKEYINKPCFLNGHPAIIEENNEGNPIVKSQLTSCPYRSWIYLKKRFPHFAGGKIFELTDNIEIIKKKIQEEENRPYHPTQSFCLTNLNYRLQTLENSYPKYGKYAPLNKMSAQHQIYKKLGLHPLRNKDIILAIQKSNKLKHSICSTKSFTRESFNPEDRSFKPVIHPKCAKYKSA